MYPILFERGDFVIHTYGLFVALGFLAAFWLMGREARRLGLEQQDFQDLGLVILVAALAGSRLFYVLVEWEYFVENPLHVFFLWKGGLVFYGGFICAALAIAWFIRAKGMPLLGTLDVAAPALALGQTLGRVGCFFAGCCYGAECDLPWAVTFTDPRSLAPQGVALHPTQLYSALSALAIFVFLYFWLRPRQKFDGQLFGAYLVLYPAVRFAVEVLRNDPRGSLGPLSTSQALGIPLFFFGLWILTRKRSPS